MAKPYSFEPRRVGSRSSVDKSSYHSDAEENRRYSDGTDRTVNRNWCICEHCSVMATVEECVCAVESSMQSTRSCRNCLLLAVSHSMIDLRRSALMWLFCDQSWSCCTMSRRVNWKIQSRTGKT